MASDDKDDDTCPGCSLPLHEPYIKCGQCPGYNLCASCFSNGYESDCHKNDHSYQIITTKFPIFEKGWQADEESKLLDALADCGPGNWQAIASRLPGKTKMECYEHYMRCYVNDPKYPLPQFPNPPVPTTLHPIVFKASEDPCRPLPDSYRAHHMSGYLAARGDFIEEYDNCAEWIVKDIFSENEDSPILKALKLAIIKIYLSRLNERARRKKIIRMYGLINSSNHLKRLPQEIQQIEAKLQPLMQVQSHPIAHDLLVHGLTQQMNLQKKIHRLKTYRQNGITCFRIAKVYEKLKAKRDALKQSKNHMAEILPHLHDPLALVKWLHRQQTSSVKDEPSVQSNSYNALDTTQIPHSTQKTIDISGLPGIEKLTEEEKTFCSNFRFVPEAFLDYKRSLMDEYNKHGTLRLQTARTIIKIDVNKTKKLYDFLIDQHLIERP